MTLMLSDSRPRGAQPTEAAEVTAEQHRRIRRVATELTRAIRPNRPEQVTAARRTVAAYSYDTEDCRQLLAALGLLP